MKIFKLSLLFLSFCTGLFAQTATLNIKLANTAAKTINILHLKKALRQDFLKEGLKTVNLDSNKSAKQAFEFKDPQFIVMTCIDKTSKKSLNYFFYLSPGDALIFTADFLKPGYSITVSGKGANNNQPMLMEEANCSPRKFYGDTLPNRIMSAINAVKIQNQQLFDKYKALYKPSASFVKDWTLKLRYQPITDYYSFKENNKYQIRPAYTRNQALWQKVQDSLFNEKTLNNDLAINAPEYLSLIKNFLGRKKESLWQENAQNQGQFYKEWYGSDTEGNRKSFKEDNTNLVCEKIINRYFTGKSADYLYTVLIENALESSLVQNLGPIFSRYKQKYPKSEYIALFEPYINQILKRQTLQLTNEMIFAKDDGKNLSTFEEVLASVKGKTVLLDMWGTWCGPCREEIEKNGKAIKDYFHGKGLDFLYIANFDTQNEKKWKELIPYFDLKGTHILANGMLTKDIMSKTKGEGYPTYVIIKKDGSFELSKAGYPMDRAKLIKQLEEALRD